MANTKTKREIIKAVKAWCDEDPQREYVSYDNGAKGHDIVRVRVYDIDIKTSVDCTPRGGAQRAAKKAVDTLKTKSRRKIQAIVEGRAKIY